MYWGRELEEGGQQRKRCHLGWDLNDEKDSAMWTFTERAEHPKELQVQRLGSGTVSEVETERRPMDIWAT